MSRKTPLICELRSRRQTLGWPLQELSRHCGIDEKFLAEWEHGVGSPRLDAVETWAAALGLTVAVVATGSEARAGVVVDWQHRRVTVEGTPVRLTPMEWKALERLAWTPGELVSHHALFQHLYGEQHTKRAQSTAVRVLITKLRRLLPVRIEAQWGQGYVISGVASSRPRLPEGDARPAAARPEPSPVPVERLAWERITVLPNPAARRTPAVARPLVDRDQATRVRAAASAARPPVRRAEELGVIERFLAERGATRCPDIATIQQSPLPTLVWDKMKRKWVRPTTSEREAS